MHIPQSETLDTLQWVDPTIYSLLGIPEGIVKYQRSAQIIKEEILLSHLCKGIINFCDLVRDNSWRVFSIPLNPDFVEEHLDITEILADIALLEVLTGNTWDRSIVPWYDYRSESGEFITGNNCRLFHQWTYSIFDIDDVEFRSLWRNSMLKAFYISIKNLYYISDLPWASTQLLELDVTDEEFWDRIISRVHLFLERYDNPEWKKLFLRQIAHSSSDYRNTQKRVLILLRWKEDVWFDEDREMYERFIALLRMIQDIFSQNNRALSEYIEKNKEVLKEELITTWRQLLRLIRLSISQLLSRD